MRTILFVCTANQCRSPVAEVTFRDAIKTNTASESFKVKSAGTWTQSGLVIEAGIVKLAQKVGVDLKGFRTTSIEDIDLNDFDWIVVMEKSHKEALDFEHPDHQERITLLTTLAGEFASDVADPARMDAASAARTLVDLQRLVRQVAQRLAANENRKPIE